MVPHTWGGCSDKNWEKASAVSGLCRNHFNASFQSFDLQGLHQNEVCTRSESDDAFSLYYFLLFFFFFAQTVLSPNSDAGWVVTIHLGQLLTRAHIHTKQSIIPYFTLSIHWQVRATLSWKSCLLLYLPSLTMFLTAPLTKPDNTPGCLSAQVTERWFETSNKDILQWSNPLKFYSLPRKKKLFPLGIECKTGEK